MIYRTVFVALSALGMCAPAALAVDGPALFGGSITDTCILTAGLTGSITANSNNTELNSKNALGRASRVVAVATGAGFKVTTIAPSAFVTAPAGGNTGNSFSSTYSLSGVTTASDVAGATPTTLNTGGTNVDVDLDVDKTSGFFTAGAYVAQVTVRCE